jgi:hypothetical protein
VVNDSAAETGDGGTQNQALPEEIHARLKEIFAWLQKDARDQIRDADHFEEMLEPISQKLPELQGHKLGSLISCDCLRNSKPIDDMFFNKLNHVL